MSIRTKKILIIVFILLGILSSKSFAIENRKERLSSQTDEAKLVEAIAIANQKEKELKNTFHNMFSNE